MRRITNSASLGAHIRAARIAQGLSQRQLAERAAISRPTLSLLENGHPHGELGLALAVIRALGLQVELTDAQEPTNGLDVLDHLTSPL
jgi:DNA-binding XRE family transcriptional regulator